MKSFFMIMRINSFTKIDNKNFNKIFLLTIKKNFKKIAEFILKNKDNANFNVHESLFRKQKDKIKHDMKIQN